MKPRILIIDDDEEIRTQMKWAVATDYHVALAGDRQEAIEVFRAHKPQVVLLDLGLPPSPNDTSEGMATLAALLAAGVKLRDAVPVANLAGGIVVGKFGTATVGYDELFGKSQ